MCAGARRGGEGGAHWPGKWIIPATSFACEAACTFKTLLSESLQAAAIRNLSLSAFLHVDDFNHITHMWRLTLHSWLNPTNRCGFANVIVLGAGLSITLVIAIAENFAC